MLDEMEAGDPDFDATVAVLAAYALPHMDEEEGDLFPSVLQLGMEVSLLGQAIAQRQKALNGDITSASPPPLPVPARPACQQAEQSHDDGTRSRGDQHRSDGLIADVVLGADRRLVRRVADLAGATAQGRRTLLAQIMNAVAQAVECVVGQALPRLEGMVG